MSIHVHGAVPEARVRELEGLVASHTTTEAVFRALDALGLGIDDIVTLDEYSLELIVGLPDGLTLVYDTT